MEMGVMAPCAALRLLGVWMWEDVHCQKVKGGLLMRTSINDH
jgi:hypothetical protein